MSSLIPILVFSLLLTYISDRNSSFRMDSTGEKVYLKKDSIVFGIMAISMAVFVGLRTNGNDTLAYRMAYEALDMSEGLANIEWRNLAAAPGLQALQYILKGMGATTQDYFMFCSLVTISCYLWFIRKYTTNLSLSVYYFITMGVYTFTMAAIKQTMAVAFLVIATDRAIEKKWVQFAIWLLIAELFHPFSFIYAIVPLLFFKPWGEKTFFLIVITVMIALSMSRQMTGIFAVTEMLGANYSEKEFMGEGVNIFRVAVVWVPVILSYMGRKIIQNQNNRATNLIINMSMINALIMFIGLFGTANYFARLANYFLIFQTLSLPWVLRIFEERSKKFIMILSIICYAAYFYYQCVLANGTFDQIYTFIRLRDYLIQLF